MNIAKLNRTLIGSLFFCISFLANAQHHPLLVQGSQQMAAGDLSEAVNSFTQLTQEQPQHQVAWYQLGEAEYKRGHYAEAAAAYSKSEELGFFSYIVRYPMAKAYAMMGDREKAFESLHKAIQAGFGKVGSLETDTELASLRDDQRFEEVILAADKVAHPCQHDAAYNALDFWVGEWDVFNKQSYRVGKATVRKELSGCAIIEDWYSIYAESHAKNYTFYNKDKQVWSQSFVNERGTFSTMKGPAEGGKVIVTGPGTNATGEAVLVRLTFEPIPETKGARQIIDHSKDDGKTWTNIGILSYARSTNSAQSAKKSSSP